MSAGPLLEPAIDTVAGDASLPTRVDVAVIGGGIVGTAAAYYLAARGLAVTLLEKGRVGGEQSGRNWGWCRQQNRDIRELPLMVAGMRLWDELGRETGRDFRFERNGLIYVTKDARELATWEAWIAKAQPYQVGSRIISPAEARTLTPGNEQDWIGGVHSPRDGRAEPWLAAPALAAAARDRGVTLVQNCAVRGLDITAGRVRGVVTERGRIAADAVLCAAGAWASMFCRRHDLDLPQAGVRSTIFRTAPAAQVTQGGLVTPDFTLTRCPDGGYIVAAQDRGRLDITPQGLRYTRQFWPMFRSRRKSLRIGIGRSFFASPEALAGRWSLDGPTPFERHREFAPPPDTAIVAPALARVISAYPALAGLRAARVWGAGSTPRRMRCRSFRRWIGYQVSTSPPASAATASVSAPAPGASPPTWWPAPRRWSTRRRSAMRASSMAARSSRPE